MQFDKAGPSDAITIEEWHAGIWRIWIHAYAFGQFRFQFGYQRAHDTYPLLIMPTCCTYKAENAQMIVIRTMEALEEVPEDASHEQVSAAYDAVFHELIGKQWEEREWARVRLDEVLRGDPLRV